uniref:hypothetical protein n=1 Tax=uncultured Draconibacterium sp. TaxID=1573823 RepID=UPI003216BE13
MEYLQQQFEKHIKSYDNLLIQLFIDAYHKNQKGIESFLHTFRNETVGLIAAYKMLDQKVVIQYDVLMDRNARIWNSLFIDGHKMEVPLYAQSAIILCLKENIEEAKKILIMDEDGVSSRFLIEQFEKEGINEALQYISDLKKKLGKGRAADLIKDKILDDSPYFFQLIKEIKFEDRDQLIVDFYIQYQIDKPLEIFINMNPYQYEENYYLAFLKQNLEINPELRSVHDKWKNSDKENRIVTKQSKKQILEHFEPQLSKWFDKDDVEYFFRSNFQCFERSAPRKLLSSKNENDYGLQSRLYKLTYSFYVKEGGKGEKKIRYAEMLKNNFSVFSGSTLRTIEKALRNPSI